MASKHQQKRFASKVGDALSACQIVEEGLKLYLDSVFLRIRKELRGKLPFNFEGEHYRNASIEKLIQVFRRLTDNSGLVRRLESFKTERNHLAHRAVADYYERHEEQPKKHVAMMKRLQKLEDDGHALWDEISSELRRIRGEEKANQSSEPTPPSVTPRAAARVAPAASMAHL